MSEKDAIPNMAGTELSLCLINAVAGEVETSPPSRLSGNPNLSGVEPI
jgi:hypothetical protein